MYNFDIFYFSIFKFCHDNMPLKYVHLFPKYLPLLRNERQHIRKEIVSELNQRNKTNSDAAE